MFAPSGGRDAVIRQSVTSFRVASAWTGPAQLASVFLLGVVTGLLGVYGYQGMRWACKPTIIDPAAIRTYRIDLNEADHAALLQLPGVGEGLADRIEAYRKRAGGFQTAADLAEVRGVGPATLQRLRPWVTPGSDPGTLPQKDTNRHRSKSSSTAAFKRPTPVNVNLASAAELQTLPGVGPRMAQRIIQTRTADAFRSVDDLRRVPGIGAKTLERLRPFVIVSSGTEPVSALTPE